MTVCWVPPAGKPIKCVLAVSVKCTCEVIASAVMPTNMTMARTPMIMSVPAALWLFGLRKFGTPLLTASTPVSAVQPDAKARNNNRPRAMPVMCDVVGAIGYFALSATTGCPVRILTRPTPSIDITIRTNPYVGTAKARPDSLTRAGS